MSKIKLVHPRTEETIELFFLYSFPPTDMAVMPLLRRLALGEICMLQELQEGYSYAVIAVDRILIGPTDGVSCTWKRMR